MFGIIYTNIRVNDRLDPKWAKHELGIETVLEIGPLSFGARAGISEIKKKAKGLQQQFQRLLQGVETAVSRLFLKIGQCWKDLILEDSKRW